MLYSNIDSKMTPSMIFKGVFKTPPHSTHRIRYAIGGRVKLLCLMDKNTHDSQWTVSNIFGPYLRDILFKI